jgi:hypothetical protein
MHAITKEELIETVKTRETWDLQSPVKGPYAQAMQRRGKGTCIVDRDIVLIEEPYFSGIYAHFDIPKWYGHVLVVAAGRTKSRWVQSKILVDILDLSEDDLRREMRHELACAIRVLSLA